MLRRRTAGKVEWGQGIEVITWGLQGFRGLGVSGSGKRGYNIGFRVWYVNQ